MKVIKVTMTKKDNTDPTVLWKWCREVSSSWSNKFKGIDISFSPLKSKPNTIIATILPSLKGVESLDDMLRFAEDLKKAVSAVRKICDHAKDIFPGLSIIQ